MRAYAENIVDTETRHHEFGVSDNRGRAIGARISMFECDMVPSVTPHLSGYVVAPGHHFAFCPMATRGGKCFGPIQQTRFFTTGEDRENAIHAYIKSALKRAMVNHA